MTNYHIWKDVTNDTWNWLLHHTGQKSKEDEWWKGDSEVGEGKENGEKMIKKVKEEGKHHLHFFFPWYQPISAVLFPAWTTIFCRSPAG